MSESSSIREDPLVRSDDPLSRQAGWIAAIAGAALLAHALAMGAIWLASRVAQSHDEEPQYERVVMEIIEPAPEPERKPERKPEQIAEAEPETLKTPLVKTEPKPAKRKLRVAAAQVPADPVDEPPAEPAKPIRRTIGLSLESTVSGGDGPSFNTGNTRVGRTSRIGNDPNRRDRRKGASAPVTRRVPRRGPNRAAAHIPGTEVKLVRPKRVARVAPKYPAVLRAQNIEGTVVLRVHIDKSGQVTKVDIVAGARHDEFNEAARIAALRERFRPATKNGVAIAYTITFSSRFRLDET